MDALRNPNGRDRGELLDAAMYLHGLAPNDLPVPTPSPSDGEESS
jgi:hypothetical protein